jgi:hypothetical protein
MKHLQGNKYTSFLKLGGRKGPKNQEELELHGTQQLLLHVDVIFLAQYNTIKTLQAARKDGGVEVKEDIFTTRPMKPVAIMYYIFVHIVINSHISTHYSRFACEGS